MTSPLDLINDLEKTLHERNQKILLTQQAKDEQLHKQNDQLSKFRR